MRKIARKEDGRVKYLAYTDHIQQQRVDIDYNDNVVTEVFDVNNSELEENIIQTANLEGSIYYVVIEDLRGQI